jgi:hypothetical protein
MEYTLPLKTYTRGLVKSESTFTLYLALSGTNGLNFCYGEGAKQLYSTKHETGALEHFFVEKEGKLTHTSQAAMPLGARLQHPNTLNLCSALPIGVVRSKVCRTKHRHQVYGLC